MLKIERKTRGILCILASAFGFALMALCVRLCDDFGVGLSCFQKGFFRNLVAMVIAVIAFARVVRKEGMPAIPRGTWSKLTARCLFGSFGIFANFYAISHIQVGEAMALNKTAPIFVVLGSWLLLGERMSRKQLLCLLTAFFGAMLVVKPGFRAAGLGAAAIGLASGLGAGLAYTCVHWLGRMKVSGVLIVLVFSAFSCLASVPFIAFDFRQMTLAQVAILFGAGVGAAIGQFGITAAYRLAEPREISVFDYSGVIFSALFGFMFFAQIPDLASVLGFILIVLGAFFLRR